MEWTPPYTGSQRAPGEENARRVRSGRETGGSMGKVVRTRVPRVRYGRPRPDVEGRRGVPTVESAGRYRSAKVGDDGEEQVRNPGAEPA